MKKACNDACDILVGRHVHPISCIVGGFTKIPEERDLNSILEILSAMKPDIDATVELAKTLKFPEFTRETEYVGLVNDNNEYPLLSGDLGSTDGLKMDKHDYRKITNEFVVPYSTAKHSRHKRDSYMVGALARLNLNYDKLSPLSKEVAKMFSLKPVNYNPFMNNIAQIVEFVYGLEDSLKIIDILLEKGVKEERAEVKIKAGRGIGAVEVPRGILFHDYTIDEKGLCTKANCIIPTNQNHRNIQKDLEELVPQIITKPQKEVELTMEMLVRAYDPCISCSTHYLDVTFV